MLPYTTYHIPETKNDKTENFDKWLWMIVQKPLSAADTDLLLKISTALKASYTEDVFCMQHGSDVSFSFASRNERMPKLIISFGVPPSELGIWIDLNRPGMRILELYTFILTLPLEELANHAVAKKELWKSMQAFLEKE